MMNDEQLHELQRLGYRYSIAKEAVKKAKAFQDNLRDEIAKRIETGDKSQKTIDLRDGSKVTVARGLDLKVDVDALDAMFEKDPEFKDFPKPIVPKTTYSLDLLGYEWYRANHPLLFAKIEQCVTSKPKAVSVTVKPPKGE